ncbi:hypothetical protein BGS_1212 [Beggiatoa sp. SS]|nr:hypothetical protein BGS_1212 [Beggiatoa sp. SS]
MFDSPPYIFLRFLPEGKKQSIYCFSIGKLKKPKQVNVQTSGPVNWILGQAKPVIGKHRMKHLLKKVKQRRVS